MVRASQSVGRLVSPRGIRIETAEVPEAGSRDLLIKVARTGICGSDIGMFREGAPRAVLGHEFAGTVVSAGAEVNGIAVGDRVVANPMIDMVGLGKEAGAFAEYLRLPNSLRGHNVFVLPETISDETGALIEPFAVGLHAVNRGRVRAGEKAVIFGAGPIGLCVLASLLPRGVTQVIVIDPSAKRRAVALAMGASAVHDPREYASTQFVKEQFGSAGSGTFGLGGPADLAFDCAGVGSTIDDAAQSLCRRGRLVLVADPHEAALHALRMVMFQELEVIGALAYDDEFHEAIGLLASGTVDLSPLITHRFPLDQLAQAFEMQMDPEVAVKVMVVAPEPNLAGETVY